MNGTKYKTSKTEPFNVKQFQWSANGMVFLGKIKATYTLDEEI
ncbi:MAG: hypothetical protein R6V37_02495 [Psychroflexus maritimus]